MSRTVLPGPPVGVDYALTEAGRELKPVIAAAVLWARKWIESGGLCIGRV